MDRGVSPEDRAIVPEARPEAWWQERHREKAGGAAVDQKIVFIGDSITHLWEETETTIAHYGAVEYLDCGQRVSWQGLQERYHQRIANLGFSGDRTQNVIWRLENGEFPPGTKAEYAAILIGTNNSSDGDRPESIAAGIGRIIEILRGNAPLTKILLLSLLPRGSGVDDGCCAGNRRVNGIIKQYDGSPGVSYIDLEQYYLNAGGTLRDELFVDKLHLSREGYELWKEKITEIIA